jgi:hemerythrin superfamily protein
MALFGASNPVFEMLKQDHSKVKTLFDEFEAAKDTRKKQHIIRETLQELDVHATLEESLIYPTIRDEIEAEDIMDEALEEHHVAHVLINELKRMSPSDDRYEAKFSVLSESVKHHIQEEEGTMFPEAEKADIDWEELAQKAMERKKALIARKSNGKTSSGRRKRRTTKGARRARARHLRKVA